MERTLIVGGGGREASIAMKLAEDSSVFAVMPHVNPTIEYYVHKTGGQYLIASSSDTQAIVEFALKNKIDLAFMSSDEALAAGVVDSLLSASIKTVGPTKNAAQIEWDKEYAMQLMRKHYPEITPAYWVVRDPESLEAAILSVRDLKMDIVVKPQGLTAGKGVKVMGVHLADIDAAAKYARELLNSRPGESVVLVEKVEGIEFTMMLLTDGASILRPPATYDYPYRFDGDTGPGTGGMGSFTDKTQTLPFISQQDYDKCVEVAKGILKALKDDNRNYNGVLNAGFFITKKGLKFLEFNARFGDPECINIMTVLNTSLLSLLKDIDHKKLSDKSASFNSKASVVKYLVTPEYAIGERKEHNFTMNIPALKAMGLNIFFSASIKDEQADNAFITVGNSRCVALAALENTISLASDLVELGIKKHVSGVLEWRRDVGSESYIKSILAMYK